MAKVKIRWRILLSVFGLFLPFQAARADFFNMHSFVEPDRFAIGLEPVLTLTNGAGLGVNLRFTYGINDVINVGLAGGSGGGDRRFRLGGYGVFDFFPDTDDQPGIGVVASVFYYDMKTINRVEWMATPYFHNAFVTEGGEEFDPFVAVPLGYGLVDGENNEENQFLVSVVVGSIFRKSEHFAFSFELGVAVNYTHTYFSGGITYFY